MRILACSDIHGSILAVDLLRKQETNSFDAVIVGGDIGSSNADKILSILSSFNCPVLYIYGNWDHELEYEKNFGPSCHHVHLSPFELGSYQVAGFSGLPTHWGLNPFRVEIETKAASKCTDLFAEIAIAEKELSLAWENRDELFPMVSTRKERRRLDKLRNHKLYRKYQLDTRDITKRVQKLNRQALAKIVAQLNVSKSIVVTHERQYRVHEDMPNVPLFLFEHNHGFDDRSYRGSRFLNVSALQMWGIAEAYDEIADYASLIYGEYVVIEISRLGKFKIISKTIGSEPT